MSFFFIPKPSPKIVISWIKKGRIEGKLSEKIKNKGCVWEVGIKEKKNKTSGGGGVKNWQESKGKTDTEKN